MSRRPSPEGPRRSCGRRSKSFWLFFFVFLACTACVAPHVAPPPTRPLPDHTLVIATDGVGYDVITEAKARGLFPEFSAPSQVFPPFPTLSIVCFTTLLEDLSGFKNPGYDVWYYDPIRQQVLGGTRGAGFELSHAYLWLFDIARRGGWSHDLGYFFPRGTLRRDIRAMEYTMRKAPRPQMVYLMSTDAVAHTMGKDELLRQLKRVSRSVTRIQRRYQKETGHKLKVVMFSDHGQDWGLQWRLSDEVVRNALAAAGYHNAGAIKAPGDVIVESFGNVKTGVVYAALEDRPGVADVISRQRGVELTFYRTPDGAVALSRERGQARIDCRPGQYRYVPQTGDPLDYGWLIERLKTDGKLDADGWASNASWLEVSKAHEYPDALHRVCGGFRDIVTYPADVLFSMEHGSMFGPWDLEAGSNLAFGGIKGNHGGISRAESSAFVMSNDPLDNSGEARQYNHALYQSIFYGMSHPPAPATPPRIQNSQDRRFSRW